MAVAMGRVGLHASNHSSRSVTAMTSGSATNPQHYLYYDDGTKTASSQAGSQQTRQLHTEHFTPAWYNIVRYNTMQACRSALSTNAVDDNISQQLVVSRAAAYMRHGSLALHSTMHTRSDHTWGAAASSTA